MKTDFLWRFVFFFRKLLGRQFGWQNHLIGGCQSGQSSSGIADVACQAKTLIQYICFATLLSCSMELTTRQRDTLGIQIINKYI